MIGDVCVMCIYIHHITTSLTQILLGEHVDYSGYPVLPMAIEQDTVIAFSNTNNSRITVCNVDEERYKSVKLKSGDVVGALEHMQHSWVCDCC